MPFGRRRRIGFDGVSEPAVELTGRNAPRLQCRLVAEGANGPTSLEADKILRDRDIPVLPDILTNAGGVTVSYFEWVQDLGRLFWNRDEIRAKLPSRFTRRFVAEETLQAMASQELPPDKQLEQKERRSFALRVLRAVHRALQELPAEDQVLVKMRLELKVADIARLRHLDQKSLYRKLDKAYVKLRKSLEQQGIRRKDVADLLGGMKPGLLDF